uniref:Uncharacterized protein n=1 Tax=Anguilla anguilla TaxID=7936 RepID=A0A0E9PJG0_ANGAN
MLDCKIMGGENGNLCMRKTINNK